MASRKFHLSASEVEELVTAFLTCRNADTKIRFLGVRLYGQGYPTPQIQDACVCTARTLLRWCADYQRGGTAALCDQRKGGNRAKLTAAQLQQVQDQLHQYTPAQLLGKQNATGPGEGAYWNIADVSRLLEQEYKVGFQTNASYYQLLAKCEMTYQRPAKQYKSHSTTKLMAFEEALEKKLVDAAQDAPDTVILAADEASLYVQASLMRVWSRKGRTPVVRVSASQDNTHFYGALNLRTGQQVSLQSTTMTSDVSALFLNRLLLTYPGVPILLLWDRATWHKGAEVKALLAAHPRLEVLWFPPGCPELNPQEHVWKAVREAVSHNHRQERLASLATAFAEHLTTTRFPCSLLEKHNYQNVCDRSK